MKKYTGHILLLILFVVSAVSVHGEKKDVLLKEIAGNIKDYTGREITLLLKLKHYDKVFEKITFYDRKNIDIEFDISSRSAKKMFKQHLVLLHEGMEYQVTFVVRGVSTPGKIKAELKDFSPRILQLLP